MCVTVNVSGVYNINFGIRWFVFFFFFLGVKIQKAVLREVL